MLAAVTAAAAAELTTGAILGSVTTEAGKPLANAGVVATSPSGRYVTTTDASGRFVILGVVADTYSIVVQAKGYQGAGEIAIVLPGEREEIAFTLHAALREIARVEAKGEAFPSVARATRSPSRAMRHARRLRTNRLPA